jgi:hypothetical protein
MPKIDHDRVAFDVTEGPSSSQEVLTAENVSLRLLLTQAEVNAQTLLAQAGIDAKEREASDKLQKLILEELHHRIKNTLATVSAIASQSLRNAPSTEHAQHAIEGRLQALGRAHDLLLQARWTSADLRNIVRGAVEAFDNPEVPKFRIEGPDVRIASGVVIAIAMTLNEAPTPRSSAPCRHPPAASTPPGPWINRHFGCILSGKNTAARWSRPRPDGVLAPA